MDFITLYTTAGSTAEARTIATTLVERRLVACANIVQAGESAASVQAVYRWQGEVQCDAETAILCKTQRSLFAAAAGCIREIHSYDTPCIVAWPIVEIDAQYAEWIVSETRTDESPVP